MKIEFDEKDKLRLEKPEDVMILFEKDKEYSISFRVIDPVKASVFATSLCFNKNDAEDIGVDFTSINLKHYDAYTLNRFVDEMKDLMAKYFD